MATTPMLPSLPPLPQNPNMQYDLATIIIMATDLYIDELKTRAIMPTPQEARLELLQHIQQLILNEDSYRPRRNPLKPPETLPPSAIAKLANAMFRICCIPCGGDDFDPQYDALAIYMESGPNKGLYVTSDIEFENVLHAFNPLYKEQDYKMFIRSLMRIAERRMPCQDRDLVAVNNGVFNFALKTFQPFSPDLVFLSKSRVDYYPGPVNPVIHNPDDGTDWDVESWMADLSDDPEIVNLLWEILGAIIRPNVNWNKSAFFYAETGNNGTDTITTSGTESAVDPKEPPALVKKIGKMIYIVRVHFSTTNKETFTDKVNRLLRQEVRQMMENE